MAVSWPVGRAFQMQIASRVPRNACNLHEDKAVPIYLLHRMLSKSRRIPAFLRNAASENAGH
jgi:hypothetical protein